MKRFICAPMATLSHEAFRRTVEKFGGCDEYFTEMINATSLATMGPFEKYYLLNGPVPEKIVWQLTGWDAEALAKAASIVCSYGGTGVDLNMGCSAPQIYKTGAGIAWMLKPLEETALAVKKVKNALDSYEKQTNTHMRLSVKCRLGPEDFTEKSLFAFTDMLVSEGVETITLHARTIKEKYRGLPKYAYVQKLALRYKDKIPIFLNGEIKDKNSLAVAQNAAPDAEGFMIARAAARKPWIFDELKNIQNEGKRTADRMQVALDFIDNVVKFQPPEFHKTRIQRFFNYYCEQFSFGHYFQTRMLNYKSPEESILEVKDYFSKESGDRYLTY